MEERVKEIDEASFEKLLDSTDKIIVVEFYSTSCPVCLTMEPIFSELAMELQEEAIFAKVNVENNMALATYYEVMGVPTFKFFCDKVVLNELFGEVNATILRNTVMDLIRHRKECKTKPKVFEIDGYG
jgi:thioredoxin 1